jgi:1-pyrroline-5-carboxylate dehydrogenase
MGNKVLMKVDEKVAIVMEQFIRLLIECGMPAEDVDFIYCNGELANKLILEIDPRMTLFTGSQAVAEKLTIDLKGKIKLEDAGFDWKILGPDVSDIEYVTNQSDKDAYNYSGQKCSAQSMLFVHQNWEHTGFIEAITILAEKRSLADLTISPLLSVTNEQIENHINNLLKIPNSHILFGGERLKNNSIPEHYGCFEPTAVYVPISEIMKPEYFDLVTTEVFGPIQIITVYTSDEIVNVLDICEQMKSNLTAAVVSNDKLFIQNVLSKTVNGTTYTGIRARTTGAPQNMFFGPAGDPRAGGIHTKEAIQNTWSCHREILDTMM